jgi:hypothetical protein
VIDQIITLPGIGDSQAATSPAVSQLRQEYTEIQTRFQAQPPNVQRFLEAQAAGIADAILQNLSQVRFNLPNQLDASLNGNPQAIPPEMHQQMVGTSIRRLAHKDLRTSLRQTLLELEQSSLPAVSASAALLRYATAMAMVHELLPAGHTVTYTLAEDDTIPSLPQPAASGSKSAIHAASDAMVETGLAEDERSELEVPYVEAARRFYLPQWVAFDDQYQLLVGSLNEAEAYIASLQRSLFVLHAAVGLAPYMVADEDYQQKRYGVLGQLVNQGRALARYQVRKIIHTTQRRAAAQDLNRGLHLSLPYFDDQKLTVEDYEFDVVPAGRILFIPAFVVRAAHEQQVKVVQDTRLSPSTRRHLLTLLYLLGVAFYSSNGDGSHNSKG